MKHCQTLHHCNHSMGSRKNGTGSIEGLVNQRLMHKGKGRKPLREDEGGEKDLGSAGSGPRKMLRSKGVINREKFPRERGSDEGVPATYIFIPDDICTCLGWGEGLRIFIEGPDKRATLAQAARL